MTPQDLVRILSRVPAFQPAIIKLAWEVIGEDGEIDAEKAASMAAEFDTADAQLRRLQGEIKVLVEALLKCG